MSQKSKTKDNRIFYTLLALISFILGMYASLAITNPSILDSDPSTFIIVPMIMGIIFILFTLKDTSADSKWRARNILLAAIAFAIYVIIIMYARVALSSEFLSYRIDAFFLPLLLLPIVIAIYGISGIKKYGPVLIYLLFASPLLLLPFLAFNAQLANFSAQLVYGILKTLGANVSRSNLSIIAPSGLSIQIAETCVPLGTFIAFFLLMIPVAYLYNGSLSKKIIWLAAGVLVFFLLNIARMGIISIAWAYYGIGSAVSTFHAFGGYIIFCASAIIMILLDKKFGLSMEFGKKWYSSISKSFQSVNLNEWPRIIAPLLIGLIVLYLSLPYLSMSYFPATSFSNAPLLNSSYTPLYRDIFLTINESNVPIRYLGDTGKGLLFQVGNTTSPNATTYMLVTFYPYEEPGGTALNYTKNSSITRYILKNGIAVDSLDAVSSNNSFYVNYFAIPYSVQGRSITANFELFSNAGTARTCNPYTGISIDYIETNLYNIMRGHSPSYSSSLCYSYAIASEG